MKLKWKRKIKKNYIGWIIAEPEDIETLQELGVSGSMIYNELIGVLEYCEIPNMRTIRKLERKFPGFWRGSFTREEEYDVESTL